MIVEAVLDVLLAVLEWLVSLFPDWDPIDVDGILASLSNGVVSSVFNGLGWLNWYLPVSELLTVLTLGLAIYAAVYVVRFVIWVLQLVHVAGGDSS